MTSLVEPPTLAGKPERDVSRRLLIALGMMLFSAVLSAWMKPQWPENQYTAGTLAQGIPSQFGSWTEIASTLQVANLTVAQDGERTNETPYDEVVSRIYRDRGKSTVMLAIAYAAVQQQEVKIHRPDLCYPSQGFRVLSVTNTPLPNVAGKAAPINVVHMLSSRDQRVEAVVYWLRTGANYGQRMWDGRLEIFTQGLHGKVPDGVLVRASKIISNPAEADAAYASLEAFLVQLSHAASPSAKALLIQ